MDDASPVSAAPNVLPYSGERLTRASAVWVAIGGLSIVAQCGFAYVWWRGIEQGLAGIAAIQANPRRFHRLVPAADVRRMVENRGRYVGLQAAFVIACAAVAGASLWFIISSRRPKSSAEIADTFRRHARLKTALTVAWVVAFFVAAETDRQLWIRLTQHVSVGSMPPVLPSLVLGGWGLFVARQFRLEAGRLQPHLSGW